MNNSPETSFSALAACRLSSPLKITFCDFFRAFLVLGLLLALGAQRLQAQDDDYLAIYGVIDQADTLNTNGKTVQAHNKYIEAKREMMTFQQTYPGWNTATVRFRLKYLDDKIAATMPSAVPAAAPSPVKLIDAGSDPKKVLRLHPAVGDKQSVTMNVKVDMEQLMGGNKLQENLPATQILSDATVTNISTDGKIYYSLLLGDATVSADTNIPSQLMDVVKATSTRIPGTTGTGQMSVQALANRINMNIPADATPDLGQVLGQVKDSYSSVVVPLPDAAVGVGAKWEYTERLNQDGVNYDSTSDFELVSIDGNVLVIHITIKQSAADQMMKGFATQGIKVHVNRLAFTATGTSTIDLAHIVPTTATLDSDLVLSLGSGQQASELKEKAHVTIESK